MPARRALPPFIPPMLARAGSVFDSRDHLYEIKWDGTRAQVLVDGDGYRLLNRRRSDLRERYPELELLRRLPRGTILDGEIVVLRDGRPDFGLLLSREHARERLRIAGAARAYPATYVVFDQLYSGFVSRLSDPLEARRARLEETLARYASSRETVAFSEGIREHGCAYFAEACRRGLRVSSPSVWGAATKQGDAAAPG
jgi:ATP-dependent DNA ligase